MRVAMFVLWLAGIVLMVALVAQGGSDTRPTDPVVWACLIGVVLVLIGKPDDP